MLSRDEFGQLARHPMSCFGVSGLPGAPACEARTRKNGEPPFRLVLDNRFEPLAQPLGRRLGPGILGDRLLLRLEGPAERGCAQIVVVDLESGEVSGRLRLAPGATVPAE